MVVFGTVAKRTVVNTNQIQMSLHVPNVIKPQQLHEHAAASGFKHQLPRSFNIHINVMLLPCKAVCSPSSLAHSNVLWLNSRTGTIFKCTHWLPASNCSQTRIPEVFASVASAASITVAFENVTLGTLNRNWLALRELRENGSHIPNMRALE